MPTPLQIKSEIETGPLSAALATSWAQVFPTESDPGLPVSDSKQQRWLRIKDRFGKLTPDAAVSILAVISDRTRRKKSYPMPVGTFVKFLALHGLLRKIKDRANDVLAKSNVRDVCDLLVTLVISSPDREIDPGDAETLTAINLLVSESVISATDRSAWFDACTKPCCRLDELGWTLTADQIVQAKG